MKLKSIFVLLIAIFLTSCGNKDTNSKSFQTEQAIIELQKDQERIELQLLKDQGIFGKWECDFHGYESIIYFKEENNQYSTIIDFKKENAKEKNEVLIKEGEKYNVEDSEENEYYIINSEGNLEIWDKQGIFATAVNMLPGQESSLPEFSIKKSIGENIFFIAGSYSKSLAETLEGTNNQKWIIYYEDINITFRVNKKTMFIQSAKSGKHPNL